MTQNALILGAAGRFGRAAAIAFHEAGWDTALWLRPERGTDAPGRVIHGDLSDAAALARAAEGVDVIVNALNPPYHKWESEVPRLTRAVIGAARASGATVLIPGNVYNFGARLPAVLTETTPEVGDHRKARIRIAMEASYRAAGVRTIVLRAGDFIDTRSGENWFEGQITAKLAEGRIVYPGPLDRVHAWAYLPDLARAAVALAERREEAPAFWPVGFPGYALTGEELIGLVEEAMGRRLTRGTFPWLALRLLSPFAPLLREVHAMRYLWNRPHRLGGAAFQAAVPEFQSTTPAEAIRAALEGAGRTPARALSG